MLANEEGLLQVPRFSGKPTLAELEWPLLILYEASSEAVAGKLAERMRELNEGSSEAVAAKSARRRG